LYGQKEERHVFEAAEEVEDEDVFGVNFVDKEGKDVGSDDGDKVSDKEFGDGFFKKGEAVFDLV